VFRRVLVANRGEIALRIVRTLREMDICSVAAFSDADRDALFVLEADEAFRLGPAPPLESYLNVDAILSVAREACVDGIHPGYGFLSENAEFAQAVADAGFTFIGPTPRAIRLMGDKVEARRIARDLGVPVVPGTPGPVSPEEAVQAAAEIGYPVAVKAAGGGGGRGIRVVPGADQMTEAVAAARREADAYFKNPTVYLERYFPEPRHVEIQVLGDKLGHLVHLGERDCSVQRRHQKLIEEAPSPVVDRDLRARMGEMALRVARSVNYSSAGTVEFLVTRDGDFFFLEMNTRIQVEHGVTERITGTDLIREMILAAAGEPITIRSDILDPDGHAIEIRVNAEDPLRGFAPTPTRITRYLAPGGPGVRTDAGVYAGFTIPSAYDSLVSKVIGWAPTRDLARRRTLRALGEYVIDGPATTIDFARAVLRHPKFVNGDVGTTFVDEHLPELEQMICELGPSPAPALPPLEPVAHTEGRVFDVDVNRKAFRVRIAERDVERPATPLRQRQRSAAGRAAADVTSPMHGTVVSVRKEVGEQVEQGETLVVIEAMKMENEVVAHRSGTLTAVSASVGETVESGQTLARIE